MTYSTHCTCSLSDCSWSPTYCEHVAERYGPLAKMSDWSVTLHSWLSLFGPTQSVSQTEVQAPWRTDQQYLHRPQRMCNHQVILLLFLRGSSSPDFCSL